VTSRRQALALIAAVGLAAAAPAIAHRGHDAISVVRIGADGAVTVSHRFEAHDLEPALPRLSDAVQASLDDPDAIAALEAHLARSFALLADGKPIALSHRRTEVTAAEVRVDYMGKLPRRARALTVRARVIGALYPRAAHQVQVETPRTVRTLRVDEGAETIALD
jgi:hypothetical protein